MNLQDLRKEITYRWKVQTGKRGQSGGWCVAYIDARDVMDLLDEVVGPGNWKDEYTPLDAGCATVKCRLGVNVPTEAGREWVSKEDVGTASDTEAEKGAFSDAFKRAAVKWGIGRFLYDLDMVWIDLDADGKPIDKAKKRIHDLTEYINGLRTQPKPAEAEAGGPAVGIIKPKEPAKRSGAHDAQRKEIANLITALGFQPKTPAEWQACIKSMTSLDLEERNFAEILDRLSVLKKEKK